MKRTICPVRVTLSALLAALCVAPAALRAEDQAISEAETALFMTDHFKTMAQAQVLHYTFSKRGSLETAYSDVIEIEVGAPGAAEGRSVSTHCLSGAQQVDMQFVESAKGNPALLCFLEHDIRAMKDLVKHGSHNYYRQRIRLALAQKAEVKAIRTTYAGKEIAAREIRVSPYLDDPHRAEFERYASKYYVFRLSDDVPGGVLGIDAIIPDPANPDGARLVEESMVLGKVEASGKDKKK